MTKTKTTTKTTTLKSTVQAFRTRAREILRARKINDLLQEIFHNKQGLKEAEKISEPAIKNIKLAEYKLKKLDKAHPDFKEKETKAKNTLETRELNLEYIETNKKDTIERFTKRITSLEQHIAEIENGTAKMSINKIQEITNTLIDSSL